MFHRLLVLTCLLLAVAVPSSGECQEFRVYTRVFNEGVRSQKPELIGRSLTLFHGGRAYDYIDNQSEVIVFEPARSQFHILNTSHNLATTVHFDQVKQKLNAAREVTARSLKELRAKSGDPRAISQLEFLLNPHFEARRTIKQRQLALSSPHLSYVVKATSANSEAVKPYLAYADWIARLNYVLHPHALTPESRIALNRQLLKDGLMPVEVELRASVGAPLHLRAEHQIHWKLDANDRALIHEWETLLKKDSTRHIPFDEYQRSIVLSQTR